MRALRLLPPGAGALAGALASALLFTACGRDAPRPRSSDTGDAGSPDVPAAAETAAAGTAAAGPAPAPGLDAGDSLPITIAGTVDGKRFEASGRGACNHTTGASIYGVPAAQWAYRYSSPNAGAELENLNVTVWEIRSGGVQVSLSLRTGGRDHSISTVRGGTIEGQGSARATPKGKGGTLSVEGTTADGRRITLTAGCERTVEPVAAGG